MTQLGPNPTKEQVQEYLSQAPAKVESHFDMKNWEMKYSAVLGKITLGKNEGPIYFDTREEALAFAKAERKKIKTALKASAN